MRRLAWGRTVPGAASVAAVDVGYGQLAHKLRVDPRVLVLERTNARTLEPEQVGGLADRVVVAIGVHPSKKPMFEFDERVAMIRECVAALGVAQERVDVVAFQGLVVETAKSLGATILIRGLRDGTDLDYEMQIAGMNQTLVPEVHTIFIPASATVRPITATLVRQIAGMGGDVSHFVPKAVATRLKKRFAG